MRTTCVKLSKKQAEDVNVGDIVQLSIEGEVRGVEMREDWDTVEALDSGKKPKPPKEEPFMEVKVKSVKLVEQSEYAKLAEEDA